MRKQGIIFKALSGFYYVDTGEGAPTTCRGRGKLRHQGLSPLVGDRVVVTILEDETGMVDEILPRKNEFYRPAVANVDQLVIIVSGTIPVTDPFLIDRVTSLAERRGCDCVICINKCDLHDGGALYDTYQRVGFPTLRVSAKTGEGIPELAKQIQGKVSAFTGNSGVGKSSILNALEPGFKIDVGEVSEKLGRGRHTTRHVELFRLKNGAVVADTPGFSSFETDRTEACPKEELAGTFREFVPYLDQCRFIGCAHIKDKGCAVLEALRGGRISQTRHESYQRLYEQAKERKAWESSKSKTTAPK